MISRTQYGPAMGTDRSTYTMADPFHEWQDRLFTEAAQLGVPWAEHLNTLTEQEIPACALDFYRAYKRPPRKPIRNPGKERPR